MFKIPEKRPVRIRQGALYPGRKTVESGYLIFKTDFVGPKILPFGSLTCSEPNGMPLLINIVGDKT